MVRLSSSDASLLMDVLEKQEHSPEDRLNLLTTANPVVRQIGEALINPNVAIDVPEIKEAVESIKRWADDTRESEEKQHLYA